MLSLQFYATVNVIVIVFLTLRKLSITGNDVPFGGKVVLFGGDFRQTLPVLRRASDTAIIKNSIISSPPWNIVQRFKLTANLRANQNDEEFKSFLLKYLMILLPSLNVPTFVLPTEKHSLLTPVF